MIPGFDNIIFKNPLSVFIEPIMQNLRFNWWQAVVGAILPPLIGSLDGGAKTMKDKRLEQYQEPSQALVDKQLGISEDLMDPNSAMNLNMRRLMSQRAMESGQQTGSQAMKIAAMRGVSPGQALMNQRIAQNSALGGVNQAWLNQLQGRFGQGLGLMGNMTQMQKGLNENMMNAYSSNIAARNKQGVGAGDMIMQMISGAMGGMGGG